MSTAGKVLVVFVVLGSVVWLILAAGVAQLNYNATEQLDKLAKQLEEVRTNLQNTRTEISTVHDETSFAQEELDRQLTTLRAQISDLENGRSQIVETLARVKYQKDIVENTVNAAKTQLEHRTAEHQAEEKAMVDLRSEVQDLKTQNGQLMARLQTLRNQYQDTHHKNLEQIQKRR
jgi:chromosome segregation ATPase